MSDAPRTEPTAEELEKTRFHKHLRSCDICKKENLVLFKKNDNPWGYDGFGSIQFICGPCVIAEAGRR